MNVPATAFQSQWGRGHESVTLAGCSTFSLSFSSSRRDLSSAAASAFAERVKWMLPVAVWWWDGGVVGGVVMGRQSSGAAERFIEGMYVTLTRPLLTHRYIGSN